MFQVRFYLRSILTSKSVNIKTLKGKFVKVFLSTSSRKRMFYVYLYFVGDKNIFPELILLIATIFNVILQHFIMNFIYLFLSHRSNCRSTLTVPV